MLHHEGQQWHWMADSYPANSVSLRSVAEGNFVVVDTTDGRHQVQAEPWQVEKLDWEGRQAFVRKTHADYYTDAICYTKLKILDQFEAEQTPTASYARGEVHLARRIRWLYEDPLLHA